MQGTLKEVSEISEEIEKKKVKETKNRLAQDWGKIKSTISVSSGGLHPGHVPFLMKHLESFKRLERAVVKDVENPEFKETLFQQVMYFEGLYQSIRPGARYFHSLSLLKQVKEVDPTIFTKSGLMVGLGEKKEEVLQVMDDLRSADVDFITIGQYLRPTVRHAPVDRYVHPDEFEYYKKAAYNKGFLMVASSPLTRSSYHAGDDFAKMRDERLKRLKG